MSQIEIEIGNPQSDGAYLNYGFGVDCNESGFDERSPAHKRKSCQGKNYRFTSKVCEMRVPICPTATNTITLDLRSESEQKIHIFIESTEAANFELTDEWRDYVFSLDRSLTRGKTSATMRIVCEKEKYDIVCCPQCFALAKVVVQAEAGGQFYPEMEADIWRKKPAEIPWTRSVPRLEILKLNFNPYSRDGPHYGGKKNLYFGDLHIHTNLSLCTTPVSGSIEDNYEYAREEMQDDFAAITDHSAHMTEKDWRMACELGEQYGEAGRFVTIPAYEWNSRVYGDRNVYFLGDFPPLYHAGSYVGETPSRLWGLLSKLGYPAITVPHHPTTRWMTNLDHYHLELEPLIEIFSSWGNAEYLGAPQQSRADSSLIPGNFVQDALARRYKMGFVAGGDLHNGKPGTSGLTGIYAENLTREAIFRAMLKRHVYATTGPKIKLDFTINGFLMGKIFTVNQYSIDRLFPLHLSVAVQGTNPIAKTEILENGCIIYTETVGQGRASEMAFSYFIDKQASSCTFPTLANYSRYYYVRVTQVDGGLAWSSPIWVDFVVNEER